MNIETWLANLGAIAAALVAAHQSWESKKEARKAKELSEPTGNGFAQRVLVDLSGLKDNLEDIKEQIVHVDDKIDTHIHDHVTDSMRRRRFRHD